MTNTNLIGLQEQLVKIDDQIFELSEKYQHRALSLVVRGWIAMSEKENAYQKRKIIYQD
jgi:hypothetical protein